MRNIFFGLLFAVAVITAIAVGMFTAGGFDASFSVNLRVATLHSANSAWVGWDDDNDWSSRWDQWDDQDWRTGWKGWNDPLWENDQV